MDHWVISRNESIWEWTGFVNSINSSFKSDSKQLFFPMNSYLNSNCSSPSSLYGPLLWCFHGASASFFKLESFHMQLNAFFSNSFMECNWMEQGLETHLKVLFLPWLAILQMPQSESKTFFIALYNTLNN